MFLSIFFRWICKIVAEKAETDKRQYLQTFKLWSFTHLDNKLFICNDHLTSAESPIVYWFRRSLCMRIERVECYKASDWPDQNWVIFLFVETTRSNKTSAMQVKLCSDLRLAPESFCELDVNKYSPSLTLPSF